MLEEYLKAIYYARVDTHSNHCCREMHNNSRLDIKILIKSVEHEM